MLALDARGNDTVLCHEGAKDLHAAAQIDQWILETPGGTIEVFKVMDWLVFVAELKQPNRVNS